ncbi:acyl carrier protein [Streptomyces sp. NBC_01217]|uniref:acyl carrier protein n=1 Tax=Streptomyces sp. NBC_01217 TaxID=2903779 RepID=UPI002E0F71B9|nr:acyl carrier protein [Streptomyces sp. NBC_01217]
MTEDQAVEIIARLICRGRPISLKDVTPDTNLVEDLGFDSLDAAELLAAVHQETGQQLNVTSLRDFQTVGGVAKILSSGVIGEPA